MLPLLKELNLEFYHFSIFINMYNELTKSEKKIARKVMDKGLDNHYSRALQDVEKILQKWYKGSYKDNREAYISLFRCVGRNDKNIGRIYNDKGGSRWVEVMAMQLADDAITAEDLDEFGEELRNIIIGWSNMMK